MHQEFGASLIENDIYANNISKEQGTKVLKSFKYLPIHHWMKEIIILQPNKIINAVLKKEDWYEVYDKSGNQYFFYTPDINLTNYQKKAYIMHKKCYQLLKKNRYDVSYNAFSKIDGIKPSSPRSKKVTQGNIDTNRFAINYCIADKYIV